MITRRKTNAPKKSDDLTTKELAFVVAYIKYYNGTKAASEAGYSEHNAAFQAWLLLKRPRVQKEIEKYEKHLVNSLQPHRERQMKEFVNIANADMGDYVDIVNGEVILKDKKDLPSQATRAIRKL